jgi:ParB family chromosome partitioning protein
MITEIPSVPVESLALPRGSFADLQLSMIRPNPENHRKFFDSEAIIELAKSIESTGLLQPISVRALDAEEVEAVGIESGICYEIILGERRWRAHQVLGRTHVECKVYHGVTRNQGKAAALIENLQRRDVNAVEEAEGYRDLMDTEGLTQEACAKRLGRSRSSVANALRVLDLPADVLEVVRSGKLTIAHGLALHKWCAWPSIVRVIAEQAVFDACSAGQLEEWNKTNQVPFAKVLKAAGLVAWIGKHEVPGGYEADWPAAFFEDADYIENGGYSFVCMVPAKWEALSTELDAAFKAKQAEALAKKEAAALAAKKAPLKSLSDLARGSYREMLEGAEPELVDLLPSSKVVKVTRGQDEDGEKVTVTLVPKFAEKVGEALRDARRADREAKWPGIIDEVLFAVNKWRKIGPREGAALMAVSLLGTDEYTAVLTPDSVQASTGKPMVDALKLDDYVPYYGRGRAPDELAPFLTTISGDVVGYARALVRDFIVKLFTDGDYTGEAAPSPTQWRWNHVISEDHRQLLLWILDRSALGLQEESAKGRRELVESVRAQDWYAAAFAQASEAGCDMAEIEDAEAA